jgi:hypothetical protein
MKVGIWVGGWSGSLEEVGVFVSVLGRGKRRICEGFLSSICINIGV